MSGSVQILKKLYIGFGAIISILLLLIVVAFTSFRNLSEANDLRAHSYQVLVHTQALREGLVNMDVAARGFVITGEVEFLPGLFQGQKDFLFHWDAVKKMTADAPDQQQRLTNLKARYDNWVTSYFEPLKAKWQASRNKRVDPDAVLRIAKQGKPFTDAMYSLVADVNTASTAQLTQRTQRAAQLQLLTQIILVVGGGFSVILAVGLSSLLTRNTKRIAKINSDLKKEIVERKQIEVALNQAKEAAEAADKAKSEFLANMSHELRTPLNAIIGFSEILQDQTFGELNVRQDKYVGNVLSSGRHLLQLINDILDLSKIEAGRMEIEPTPFNVTSAISDVVTITRSLAAQKRIELTVETQPDLPILTADESKFKQILYNLISNAIKFTPDDGDITLTARLSTREDNQEAIRVAVTDTGIGIKPQDQQRVFSEFEQIDSSYGRQQQGTGLGLALTRRFVEMHGGHIWVESDGEGSGSTFIFEIPLEPTAATSFTSLSGEADYAYPPVGESRPIVLVVENERQARELLTHYLQEAGYGVAYASNGEQALRMAHELTLHAIVLDILLPKKDGWDVLTELKSRAGTREIPVIIVSITENRELGFSLGAIEYFVKPVDRDRLIEVVRHARTHAKKENVSVLVVDDDRLNVGALTHTLQGMGCSVLPAYGGQQGIDLAISKSPDFIILDLMMPEVTGFDVVRQLRDHPTAKYIPILILTAKDITEADRQLLNDHARAIVPKAVKENLMSEIAKLNIL